MAYSYALLDTHHVPHFEMRSSLIWSHWPLVENACDASCPLISLHKDAGVVEQYYLLVTVSGTRCQIR